MLDTKYMREVWIPALRSGNYEQTRGALSRRHLVSDQQAYCCLGVYCLLHPDIDFKFSTAYSKSHNSFTGIPTDIVEQDGWASGGSVPLPYRIDDLDIPHAHDQLRTPLSLSHNGQWQLSFIALNDDNDYTFEQIADVAEWVCDLWDGNESN